MKADLWKKSVTCQFCFQRTTEYCGGKICRKCHTNGSLEECLVKFPIPKDEKKAEKPTHRILYWQTEVDIAVHQQGTGYWDPFPVMTRMTEEVGEIAREINHLHGPKRRRPEEGERDLGAELGDLQFTLICMANQHQINLDEEVQKAIRKCYERDKDRFREGS